MKYQTIKGVRFQKGINKELINAFLGEEETHEKFVHSANDDLCFFEHLAVGGSAPSSLRPLIPYSILAGNRTAEDLAKGRNRQGSVYGRFVIDPSQDYKIINGGHDGGNLTLVIPKSIRLAFFETILSLEPIFINPKYPTFICTFSKPEFDSRTNRIILPNIETVNHQVLSKKFRSKIKLKEVLMSGDSATTVVIDRKGWRINLRE